jgi:hypothetical protein
MYALPKEIIIGKKISEFIPRIFAKHHKSYLMKFIEIGNVINIYIRKIGISRQQKENCFWF